MADFTQPSIFSAENNFVKTTYAASVPLMETELNEMQDIQNYKRNLAIKQLLGNGFLNKLPMTLSAGVLAVPADVLVIDGDVFEVLEDMKIGVVAGDTVYLKVHDEEVTYNTALKKSGNLSSGTSVPNKLWDERINKETTRRVQKQVELVKEVPTTPDIGVIYLELATIGEGNTFTDNRTKSANTSNDYSKISPYAEATGVANTYEVANPEITELVEGMSICIKIPVNSTGTSTFNWSGTGAKAIKTVRGKDALNLKAGEMHTLRYDGTNYVVQGDVGSIDDFTSQTPYSEATGIANSYNISLDPAPTALVDGLAIAVKIPVDSTGASTINVNSLGEKAIKNVDGTDAINLKAEGIYTLRYNGEYFIVQGASSIVQHKEYQHIVTTEEVGMTVIDISSKGSYTVGSGTLLFFLNGIKQELTGAYTETSSTTITTTSGLLEGDFIDIHWIDTEEYSIASHATTHSPGGGDDISSFYTTKESFNTHLAEAFYLQEDEPEATNSTTLWFDSNSEINFSAGGVAIYNAETSTTPPETVFWFQPV